MPQLIAQENKLENQEVDLNLDAIGGSPFIDSGTMNVITGAQQMALQSASMALASIPNSVFQQIAIAQDQHIRIMANTLGSMRARILEDICSSLQHFNQALKPSAMLAKQLHALTTPKIALPRLFVPSVFTGVVAETETYEEVETVSVTTPIIETFPVIVRPRRNYANFGFEILLDGRFEYRSRILKSLYHTSMHGKLLVMLIEAPGHYVADNSIKSKFSLDPVKGVPNLMSELKSALRKDGIELKIHRHWGEGYTLEGAKYPVKRS